LTPATYGFGNVALPLPGSVITSRQETTFVFTNTTSVALRVTAATLSANAPPYSITKSCAGQTIAAGSSCPIVVDFTPTALGSYPTTLTVTTDLAGTLTSSITGTAVASSADFMVTASPSSQSVIGGSTAIYTLTVAPAGGTTFNQPITLSASGLPAGASAVFSNSTVTPQGASVQTFMDVVTTATHAQNTRPTLWPLTGPISAAVLLFFPWVRRKRMISSLLGLLVLMGISGAVMGCGANAVSTAASGPTTITVTATSGTIVHTTTVTLTIQ